MYINVSNAANEKNSAFPFALHSCHLLFLELDGFSKKFPALRTVCSPNKLNQCDCGVPVKSLATILLIAVQ